MPSRKSPKPSSPQRTLGPVSDLERHLPADWWRTLFNSVYLKTDGDVVENDQNTVHEVDTIVRATGMEPGDRILDLCCGQGRHSLELARRGYARVTGLDRSRYLVRLARQRARRQGLDVSFREGDARRFRLPDGAFHYVMLLGNSFGYFESAEDDLRVLEACRRLLGPRGTVVLDLTDGAWTREHFEPRSWEWIDEQHFVCRERSLAADGERLISREVVTHAEKGVIVDQFYAERLYSEAGIRDLLERAGFEAVRVHGELQARSERDQDLGMMAQRLLITASVPKAPPAAAASVPFPRVTVLLGDPRLPDEVKRDGQFNPEDLDTVDRLRRALDELEAYEFEYFDNHEALLSHLRAEPPEFVLNLCDEGFMNDAFLELHVPAYLEMLGVPYSGAGPTCLGLCYNKAQVRALAEALDIPVPLETYVAPGDQSATLPATFPVLVKPNFGDSSVGITKDALVHTSEDLVAYIETLKQDFPGRPVLVQEFLSGAEYSVGVVGNPGTVTQVFPVLQVNYTDLPEGLPHLLGYESKWEPDSPYWSAIRYEEADLSDEAVRTLQDHALTLFERLGCHDYARFDFRADAEGAIKLLEANPNPGWCWDGKLNLMAGFAGLRYADLLRLILEAAQERSAVRAPAHTSGDGAAVLAAMPATAG